MADKQETMGVFLPEGEGKPVVIIAPDSPFYDRFQQLFGRRAMTAPASSLDEINNDIKEYFESQKTADNRGNVAALEVAAGEARTAMHQQALVEAVQKQAKADITKSVKAQLKMVDEAQEDDDASADERGGGETGRDPGDSTTNRPSAGTSSTSTSGSTARR